MNGPRLSQKQQVAKLIGEAMQQYKYARNRCQQRSSSGVRRKRRVPEGGGLSDLLGWAVFMESALESDEDLHVDEAGFSLPDVVRMDEEEERERQDEIKSLCSIPSYVPEEGWVVMELPDAVPCPGVPEMCITSDKFLRKKEVA